MFQNNRKIKTEITDENIIKQIWLGRQDSNLRMLVPKTSALPLGDDPLRIYSTLYEVRIIKLSGFGHFQRYGMM